MLKEPSHADNFQIKFNYRALATKMYTVLFSYQAMRIQWIPTLNNNVWKSPFFL